jgi:hypothetical protein
MTLCQIIYKESGAKVPTEKVVKTCHTANKDGFGVMWRKGDKIQILKGLYDLPTINKIVSKIPENCEAAFHFRQATHGGVSAKNCHPFPILERIDALQSTIGSFDTGIVHNGVIHEFGDSKSSVSDTMNFVRYLARRSRFGFDRLKRHIPAKYGKFIIFTPKWTYSFGTFIKDYGLEFSSSGYREYEQFGCLNKNVADKKVYPNKLSDFPIIEQINPDGMKWATRFLGEEPASLVYYKGVYGSLMQYKDKYIFVEEGATHEDIGLALLDIEADALEDGLNSQLILPIKL